MSLLEIVCNNLYIKRDIITASKYNLITPRRFGFGKGFSISQTSIPYRFPKCLAAPPKSASMPIAPVCIAWVAPACIVLLVCVVDIEDVVIIVEEATLKATGPAVIAVGLMETVVLLGLRTLLRGVSICYILHIIFSVFCNSFRQYRDGIKDGRGIILFMT